jgi:hypothetical protein
LFLFLLFLFFFTPTQRNCAFITAIMEIDSRRFRVL